eukprot:gene12624-13913_t
MAFIKLCYVLIIVNKTELNCFYRPQEKKQTIKTHRKRENLMGPLLKRSIVTERYKVKVSPLFCSEKLYFKKGNEIKETEHKGKSEKSPIPASRNGHVMLSYQWSSQSIVMRIRDELLEMGYPIWMDVDKMHGHIYEKMGKAVKDAIVVVPFLSSEYEKSENCMRELRRAADKDKKIVPVKLGESYQMNEETGLIVAGKLYIDFSDGSRFDENIKALTKEVDEALDEQLPPTSKNRDSEKKEESLIE